MTSKPELLALPVDVLLTILQQSSLGARELCRLELCNSCLLHLIDEQVWKQAFLHRRHFNALREPESWKKEFARRDSWSISWRQLIACSSPPAPQRFSGHVSAHTQKLRRFAMKMVSSSGSGSPKRATHIVDANGGEPGCFSTITAALAYAQPFDRVLVRPGRFCERLKLERPVEVIGTGPLGTSVVVGIDGPTVETSSRVACRVANLCIEQRPRVEGTTTMSGAVLIKGAAVLVVEECTITSDTGHGIVIQGNDSCGYVMHNVVHHAKGVGILVCDHAKGVVEDNIISCNGRAGVAILSGGDPVIAANKIHDGLDSGVLVSEKGRGRVEDNDIFGNRRAGVAILKEGAPIVKRNRIHDGCDSGVLVCENGKGAVVDNDIFANQMAGVAIGRGGASRVTGNTIRDGNGGSLCLSVHSKGLISSNVIHQDPRAAMQVPEGLLPEVKEHNVIKYAGEEDDDEANSA